MLVVVILANGLLQNLFQPFAMGSALDLNPLVVLVVTIGAGCLFGMLGLVLAAPLVSAVVRIGKSLDQPLEPAPRPRRPRTGRGRHARPNRLMRPRYALGKEADDVRCTANPLLGVPTQGMRSRTARSPAISIAASRT